MNGRTNSTSTGAEFIEIPLDPVTNFSATPGNGNIELKWTDPKNKYATDEGETAQDPDQLVSVWKYTKIVRKIGEYPQNPNDGVVVVESGVHNQYQANPYVDTGLENDTTYYYCAYAINEDEVASEPAQVHATSIVGIMLSTLSEGTLIKINENGSPIEFYITKHNYQSDLNGNGRTLVVRKDAWDTYRWNEDLDYWLSDYVYSRIPAYLNGTYKNMFSAKVKSLMSTTKFYSGDGNYDDTSTLTQSIFLPSYVEMGLTNNERNHYTYEGTLFPIYKTLILCYYNSTKVTWNTRTGVPNYSETYFWAVDPSGEGVMRHCGRYWHEGDSYLRPCFTLPETSTVDTDMLFMENQ